MSMPADYRAFLDLMPEQVQQLVDDLIARPLTRATIEGWLNDWGTLAALFQECMARFDIAIDTNTADEAARQRQADFRATIWPMGLRLHQQVDARLQSHADLLPARLRAAVARHSAANQLNQIPRAGELLHRQAELSGAYSRIMGAQMLEWDGQTVPLRQVEAVVKHTDRHQRERAWRALHERSTQDYAAISRIWAELIDLRVELAELNGFDNYLDYRWVELGRTDYTPADSQRVHEAILLYWVPLHTVVMERKQAELQLDRVRPWDATSNLKPLRPFTGTDDLLQKTINLFRRMDPAFGVYVVDLNAMGFIDLADRAHTRPVGGFSRAVGRHGNFIFLNITHTHDDMVALIHEIGHAVATHASCQLPYLPFWGFPADFVETPSTVMEMLSLPYWDEFYDSVDWIVAQQCYYRDCVSATLAECVFDAFQHWVYGHPTEAREPATCDAQWHALTQQYRPGIDWGGVEHLNGLGWQRMSLNFHLPLHALEYVYGRVVGLRLLNMVPAERIKLYKAALALGNSVSARELFAALGVEFPLSEAVIRQTAQNSLAPYL